MGKQLYLELDRWIREEYWENHKTEWHYASTATLTVSMWKATSA